MNETQEEKPDRDTEGKEKMITHEIETKFDIGDTVFYLRSNIVWQSTVTKIVMTKADNNSKITTTVTYFSGVDQLDREKIFPSKEELLKSL